MFLKQTLSDEYYKIIRVRTIRPAAACLLASQVQIPLGAWIFVSYVVLACVGRGVCDGLITRPEESYRVSNAV